MRRRDETKFAIDIGTDSSGNSVEVDVATLLSTRALVCANSGGGKSYLLRKLIELIAGTLPTLVIDPDGEFATLREMVDLVIVGPSGEVPASPATASKLARRLVELRVNAVLDLSELSLSDKQLFVKNFLDSLLTLPRELWLPILLVIDEAHKFASTELSDCTSTGSVVALMDQGRKRRIGGVLATQRLSKLVASARAEANNIFIGRTAQDIDLKRAADLLGLDRKDWPLIRRASPGSFYAHGPAFSKQDGIVNFRTKPVQTTHEEDRASAGPPRPSRTIVRVVAELSDLQQEVDRETDELTRLRDENAKLRTRTTSAPRAPDTEGIRAKAEQDGYARGWAARGEQARAVASEFCAEIDAATKKFADLAARVPPPRPQAKTVEKALPPTREHPRRDRPEPRGKDEGLGSGAVYKICVVLVAHGEAMTRSKAAFLAKVSPTTTTFRNALSRLRVEGLVEDLPDGRLKATRAAVDRLGAVESIPSGAELQTFWRGKFGDGAPGKLFSVLVEFDRPVSRETAAIAADVSPVTTTFRNALSTLRRTGVLVDHPNGDIGISPDVLG